MHQIKNRISKGYWLWCQFSDSNMKYLEKLKSEVNKKICGHSFDIHLTLVGPYLNLDEKELNLIRDTSNKIKKFHIKLSKYSYSENKFKSLFTEVEKTNSLLSVRKKFNSTNYINKSVDYNPHVSLFYGNIEKNRKVKLISKFPELIKSCIVEKICIVDVDENINQWNIIERINLD